MAVMRPESRPMDVVRVHAHLMISAPQVELGEKAGAPKFIQEFVDDWDRKLVLDRLVIQGPEVNAELPRTIMFLDQQDRAETGDTVSRMIPWASISSHWRSISFFRS